MAKNQNKSVVEPIVNSEMQEELASRSAVDQMENDQKQWENFFNAGTDEAHPLPEGSSPIKQYANKQEVMKRIFMLVQNVGVTKTKEDAVNHPELSMNVASILSHGGRLVIEIPPLSDTDTKANSVKAAIMGEDVDERKEIIYKRAAASHTLEIVKDKNDNKIVVEGLLKTTGLQGDYGTLTADAVSRRHYGMNIGLTHNGAGPDNGTNGHVYFYWLEPDHNNPGGLMVGVETCEAGKTNPYGATHDAGAVAGQFSSTGGTKFSSNAFKEYLEAGLTLSPADKNGRELGLKVELSPSQVTNIKSLVTVDKDHPLDLGKAVQVKVRHGSRLTNATNKRMIKRVSVAHLNKIDPESEPEKRKNLGDKYKQVDVVANVENKLPLTGKKREERHVQKSVVKRSFRH